MFVLRRGDLAFVLDRSLVSQPPEIDARICPSSTRSGYLPIQAGIQKEPHGSPWHQGALSASMKRASSAEAEPSSPNGYSKATAKVVCFPSALPTQEGVIDQIRCALAAKNLSVSQASKITESLHGQHSASFIPQTFYQDLRENTASPHICQVIALSHLTNEPLVRWLSLFGFRLDDIPRLQAKLHGERTVILTSTTYDKYALVPWFWAKRVSPPADGFAPLVQIAGRRLCREPVEVIERLSTGRYLYLKIGRRDALAFPELVPGSICRVDPQKTNLASDGRRSGKRPIYAVAHASGVCCCHVNETGDGKINLVSNQLSYPAKELTLTKECSILGTVDLEIRPLRNSAAPRVLPFQNSGRATNWPYGAVPMASLSGLIRGSRERLGMHFREASKLAAQVAKELQDDRYSVAVGTLSDYEASNAVPRHIHKIVSLCILYCIDFSTFLAAAGLAETTRDTSNPEAAGLGAGTTRRLNCGNDFLAKPTDSANAWGPIEQFEEIPLFLQHNLEDITRLRALSISDCFYVGHNTRRLHPLLDGAFLIAVNKRRKRIVRNGWTSQWDRPLHLVLKRDGSYVCGACSLSGDTLTVHPHPDVIGVTERFKLGQDAEIVGEVVCVVRRLIG